MARPQGEGPFPAVAILFEAFGLNANIEDTPLDAVRKVETRSRELGKHAAAIVHAGADRG